MIAGWRVAERVTRVTPFGFRLWDPVLGQPVAAGLTLRARSGAASRAVTSGPSGVFAIRDLPLSEPFVGGEGDDAFWASPPAYAVDWTVDVTDALGRFLPLRIAVSGVSRVGRVARLACRLPVPPAAGGAPEPDGAAAHPMPMLPLFSAPARPAPDGIAAVTARLERTDGRSAAGSVLEVRPPGAPPAYGLADARGVVSVLLPYPEPQDGSGLSPVGPRRPLTALEWEGVEVRAYPSPGDDAGPPELCATLELVDATPARLLATASPPADLAEIQIGYGRPTVLRTAGGSALLMDAD